MDHLPDAGPNPFVPAVDVVAPPGAEEDAAEQPNIQEGTQNQGAEDQAEPDNKDDENDGIENDGENVVHKNDSESKECVQWKSPKRHLH